jgi:hypothetical protein
MKTYNFHNYFLKINFNIILPSTSRSSNFSALSRLAFQFFLSLLIIISHYRNSPTQARTASFLTYPNHKQWHTTVGRTPLEEGSAHRRGLYLTTQNTHKRQDIHAPARFEPAIPANERPQTLVLDRSVIGIDTARTIQCIYTEAPVLSGNVYCNMIPLYASLNVFYQPW